MLYLFSFATAVLVSTVIAFTVLASTPGPSVFYTAKEIEGAPTLAWFAWFACAGLLRAAIATREYAAPPRKVALVLHGLVVVLLLCSVAAAAASGLIGQVILAASAASRCFSLPLLARGCLRQQSTSSGGAAAAAQCRRAGEGCVHRSTGP
jgi:hypothetical protein